MGFSVSVLCHGRVERDAVLGFLHKVDWETLGQENLAWAGTRPVGGKQLLYPPNYRREFLLGFNGDHVNHLMLATAAWVTSRQYAQFHHRAEIFVDQKPRAVVVGRQRKADEHDALRTDAKGILDFSHLPLIERGLGLREHTRLQHFFDALSEAWPLGEPVPQPSVARRFRR